MDPETREKILKIMYDNAQSMLDLSEKTEDIEMATTARSIIVCVAAARNGDVPELSMFIRGFMRMISEKHGLHDIEEKENNDLFTPNPN
jgi:hypothetical protein